MLKCLNHDSNDFKGEIGGIFPFNLISYYSKKSLIFIPFPTLWTSISSDCPVLLKLPPHGKSFVTSRNLQPLKPNRIPLIGRN